MVSDILALIDSIGFKARFEELRKFNNDILYGVNRANEKLNEILSKIGFSDLLQAVTSLLNLFKFLNLDSKLAELRKFSNDILYAVNRLNQKLDQGQNDSLKIIKEIKSDLRYTTFSVTEYRYQFEAVPKSYTVQLSCPKIFQSFFSWLGRRNEDISKILCEFQHKTGVDELKNSSLPASLIQMHGQSSSAEVNVPSLVRLLAWQFERVDEIFGQWSVPIKIDGEIEGSPRSEIVQLPNLAEAVGEIYSILLNNSANSEKILNLSVKNLIEAGEIRVNSAKNFFAIVAILDCLGANVKETGESIPLSFKVNVDNIDDMLKSESTVKLSAIFYPDSEPTIRENMHDLLHAAAIIRAVHWRKIDLKDAASAAGQIAEIIKQYKQTKDKVENDSDEWDQFISDTELGYTNQVGISDSARPYGRKYEQRPRIKKLGDQQ